MTEEELAEKSGMLKGYFHDVESDAMRACILNEGVRLDGRKSTQIRPIWSEVDYLLPLTVQQSSRVAKHNL